ncbi:hypothetical protein CUN67_27180 (plasmid) [Pantoea cypripedii]|uniref:Uncharacterized protein n=1 Tax=Pantoea cypripedii TaxID=55209 RepID=A0A6B9G9U2_PANCY|nr:hypothetical protein CUN67_27180 [Pantoea cypripedii]
MLAACQAFRESGGVWLAIKVFRGEEAAYDGKPFIHLLVLKSQNSGRILNVILSRHNTSI